MMPLDRVLRGDGFPKRKSDSGTRPGVLDMAKTRQQMCNAGHKLRTLKNRHISLSLHEQKNITRFGSKKVVKNHCSNLMKQCERDGSALTRLGRQVQALSVSTEG